MNVLIIGRTWGRVFVNPFVDRGHAVTVCTLDWWRRISRADIVDVATPPRYHCAIAGEALTSGCHVLCEKPFGLTVGEAEAMYQAGADEGKIGVVNYEFRYEPALQEIKKRGARISEVLWMAPPMRPEQLDSWRASDIEGGGLWNSFGSHALDYIHWTGSPDAAITLCRSNLAMHQLTLADFNTVELYRDGGPDTRPECVDRLVGEFLDAIDGKPAPSLPTFADGVYVRQQLEKRHEG